MNAKECLKKIIEQKGHCDSINCESDNCYFNINHDKCKVEYCGAEETLEISKKELQAIIEAEKKLKFLENLK